MNRTIRVKGQGQLQVKPDETVVSMTLANEDPEYQGTLIKANESLKEMMASITKAGFKKEDLKTSDLNVRINYQGKTDPQGNYKNEMVGYISTQRLKLRFDLDSQKLANLIEAVGAGQAAPELNIQYKVKDENAVKKMLLKVMAEDAREKAEILTHASGVSLGELLNISYGQIAYNFLSPTTVHMEKQSFRSMAGAMPEVEAESIEIVDEAEFIWAIE